MEMRENIFILNRLAPIFREHDPIDIEIVSWLFLSELPQLAKDIPVDSRKKQKHLTQLKAKGIISRKHNRFGLTKNGIELVQNLHKHAKGRFDSPNQ